ncbi:MAG TPA: hypothetical protein VKV21_11610 [Solirubrobacteraceae bacterium]|nr:hypothetical protein [Solirubrobacteraceae bacterium]
MEPNIALLTGRPVGHPRARSIPPVGHLDANSPNWPVERVLFALGGTVTIISALLSLLVTRWFALMACLVGVNQWLYVATGSCPASLMLRCRCRLRSTIESNSRAQGRAKGATV